MIPSNQSEIYYQWAADAPRAIRVARSAGTTVMSALTVAGANEDSIAGFKKGLGRRKEYALLGLPEEACLAFFGLRELRDLSVGAGDKASSSLTRVDDLSRQIVTATASMLEMFPRDEEVAACQRRMKETLRLADGEG